MSKEEFISRLLFCIDILAIIISIIIEALLK